jgi:hypothetical protein
MRYRRIDNFKFDDEICEDVEDIEDNEILSSFTAVAHVR